MDWKTFIPAVIGALIVAAGWIVGHYLNISREIAAEKRKTRVAFLLEAYRKLESVGNRNIYEGSKHIDNMETALADIQLLGTPKQARLAREFSDAFAENGTAPFDPLLYDLRKTLREELDLEPVEEKLKFLRIIYGKKPSQRVR
jgi:hypothetical protein